MEDLVCGLPLVEPEERRAFYVEGDYSEEYKGLVKEIIEKPYFYASMEAISGGRVALEEMRGLGWDVWICTAPRSSVYLGCVAGKYMWVHQNLGGDWIKRIIVTKDKTLVEGDILIDDRPNVRGVVKPRWEHVLFDQPYNRDVKGRRRLTWENWREVLEV